MICWHFRGYKPVSQRANQPASQPGIEHCLNTTTERQSSSSTSARLAAATSSYYQRMLCVNVILGYCCLACLLLVTLHLFFTPAAGLLCKQMQHASCKRFSILFSSVFRGGCCDKCICQPAGRRMQCNLWAKCYCCCYLVPLLEHFTRLSETRPKSGATSSFAYLGKETRLNFGNCCCLFKCLLYSLVCVLAKS